MQGAVWMVVVVLATTGCKRKVDLFCDEDTPCEDPARPFCDLDGEFPASEGIGRTCIPDPFADLDGGIDGGAEPDAQVVDCTPNETTCEGNELVECDANGMGAVQICPLGCNDTEPRCNDLDPSNDLAAFLDMTGTAPDVVLTDGAVIDTSTGTVTNGDASDVTIPNPLVSAPANGVDIRVFMVKSLTLGDTTITANGTGPAIAIVSDGDIRIEGIVQVEPGAGEMLTDPPCQGNIPSSPEGGGGGGGYGLAGAPGGNGTDGSGNPVFQGGAGGQTSGTADLVPLRGGCRGSFGAVVASGGGAIQLSSRARIEVGSQSGIIAGGEGGQVPAGGIQAASGGGSGGAILVEAPIVTFGSAGGLAANGGGGGTDNVPGTTASELTVNPTPGAVFSGNCCGEGGDGGAGSTPAQAGETQAGQQTIGGGGGVGRLRINSSDPFVSQGTEILSPAPSAGSLEIR